MQKRYTKNAQKAIDNAKRQAVSLGHNYVGTEHILLALLNTKGDCRVSRRLCLRGE